MTKLFHIRQPQPRRGPRHKKTLCGAQPTEHDNSFSWQIFAVTGQYVLCEQCEAVRALLRTSPRKSD